VSTSKNLTSANRNYWCDSIRGYAVLLVCISHFFYIEPVTARIGYLRHYIKGDTGVFMFYVLSGFLVTGILYREVAGQNSWQQSLLAVKNFFGRRVFRLQPSYLVFLLCYLLLPAQDSDLSWWTLLFPLSNWFAGPYSTWHIKTLHIEEIYYLFIGLSALLFWRSFKSFLWTLLIAGFLGRVATFAVMKFGGYETARLLLDCYLPLESFSIGGLLAFYMPEINKWNVVRKIQDKPVLSFILAMCALLIVSALRPVKPFSYVLLLTWSLLFSIISAVMIVCGLKQEQFIFSNSWANYLGRISYTVYLFQQFALGPWEQTYKTPFSWTLWFMLVVGITILLPLMYNYFEKPLIRYGSKFFPRIGTV